MAFRRHLVAHLTSTGPDPELCDPEDAFFLDSAWAGALLSVWGSSSIDVDWRLAKISRRHRTLALRATTEDDYRFQLVIFLNGERTVRLSRVYFEDFEEAMELLTDFLEVDRLPPDRPLDEAHRAQMGELIQGEPGQTWLLGVEAGVAPRQAYLKVGRQRAVEIAGVADAAGLAPDVELLGRFFTGELRREEIEAHEGWENFGDLLLFVQALGLGGFVEYLEAEAGREEEEPEEDEDPGDEPDEDDEDEDEDPEKAAQKALKRKVGKTVVYLGCPLMLVAVGALIWLGSEVAGGAGAAGAVLALLLVAALFVRSLWRRFTARFKAMVGGESLEDPGVAPALLHQWRTLLFNWRDLVYRCGAVAAGGKKRRPQAGLFDALYADTGVPTDPAGQGLLERMADDAASIGPLATEVGKLRLALLDAEIAGADVEPLHAGYRELCKRLLGA